MDVVGERESNTFKIILSKDLYEKDAILSAAYAFSVNMGLGLNQNRGIPLLY